MVSHSHSWHISEILIKTNTQYCQHQLTQKAPLSAVFAFSIIATLLAAAWSRYGFLQVSSYIQSTIKGETKGFTCRDQHYITEIVSVDPLVMWIEDFVSFSEADQVIAVGYFFFPYSTHYFLPSYPYLSLL
jgi:hypothetical protein